MSARVKQQCWSATTNPEAEIAWPVIMPDADELHKFWNKNEITTPDDRSKIVGFHNFSRKLGKGHRSYFSLGEIELHFPINKTMNIRRIGGTSESRVAHVELTALENSDHLNQDKDDFDVARNLFFFCVHLCFA